MSDLEVILAAIPGRISTRGDHHYFRCPVHGGKDPDSASVRLSDAGKVLFHCHSKGCSFGAFLDALGVSLEASKPEPVQVVYQYQDADGHVVLEVVREPDKKFWQRGPDGTPGVSGLPRLPYRLPRVLQAVARGELVYWVEGEKDVHRLEQLGLTATTSMGGAGGKWRPEWDQYFHGASVVILPDNDEPGAEYAKKVAKGLGRVADVRIVELPGLPEKGDVSDWLKGKTRSQLEQYTEATEILIEDFPILHRLDLPERRLIMAPWWREQDMGMICAPRGVGKTYFTLTLACALAAGMPVFGWSPARPLRVVDIDGEMAAVDLRGRIWGICHGTLNCWMPADGHLQIISRDRMAQQGRRLRYLSDPDTRRAYLKAIPDDTDVVIFDNLSCLVGGAENDAETWDDVQDFLLALRFRGISTVFVHHTGKNGDQRGTSRREDVLDWSMALNPPDVEEGEDSSGRFTVEWKKARSFRKSDVPGFAAELNVDDIGSVSWNVSTLDDERMIQVLAGYHAAMEMKGGKQPTVREVAECSRLHRNTVHRYLKKAREQGFLRQESGQ